MQGANAPNKRAAEGEILCVRVRRAEIARFRKENARVRKTRARTRQENARARKENAGAGAQGAGDRAAAKGNHQITRGTFRGKIAGGGGREGAHDLGEQVAGCGEEFERSRKV